MKVHIRQLLFPVLVLLFSLTRPSLFAQTYNLSPPPLFQFLDNNGLNCSGCILYSYAAGTTTPLATYSDSSGTSNGTSLTLDASGRGTVYLSNVSYKFVLKTAAGATLWTRDNVATLNTLVAASLGGTGLNTSSSNGVPSINAGTWGVNAITQNGVLYGGASNALAFTSAPSANSVLTVSAGVPTWSTTPQVTRLGLGTAADGTAVLNLNGTILGSISASTVGPHVLGGATDARYQLYLSGSFAASGADAASLVVGPSVSVPAGDNAALINVSGTLTKAGSGTHAELALIRVGGSFGAGSATVTDALGINLATFTAPASTTNASGLRVAAPTGATNNYAINILSGVLKHPQVTVALLPTCNAGNSGSVIAVSDSNATTFNAIIAGAGTNVVLSMCDGTNWRIH